MKSHAIIPIFIPHDGCPNDCVFCNQKAITARSTPPSLSQVTATIETHLSTLRTRHLKTIEIAFYGGSFTGIPIEQQQAYLSLAKRYKESGIIHKIHLSTRPDYIDDIILTNLKQFGVDIIELGVQSFNDEVLRQSGRGHDASIVYKSCSLIQDYGFTLGLQLMIGLPGSSYAKDVASAREAVKIGPAIGRLYPTVIISDTELFRMYERGAYRPLSLPEAIKRTKDMYVILREGNIHVIRIGLKSSDLLNDDNHVIKGTFHPAFRQLVESELAKQSLEEQLISFLRSLPDMATGNIKKHNHHSKPCVTFLCSGRSFSNMIGNGRANRIYFEEKYPHLQFRFSVDSSMVEGIYRCVFPPVYLPL